MTRPSLPSSLRPRVSDYGFNSPAGADSSAVEGGVDRYGLAYESAAQIFSVTLILDLYEFSVWNLFYLRKTAMGTITFEMVLDSGHGLAPHACNIVTGSYSAKRTAGNAGMVVTFQVQAESQAFEFLDDDVDAQLAVFEVFGRQGPGMLTRIGVFANSDTLAFADFPAVNMVTADVDPAITFTRAGPKTYFDQAGNLRTATANVWPLEYHPVTRRALGRRVEPAATNLVLYSEQFAAASSAFVWQVGDGLTVAVNAQPAPDGSVTGEFISVLASGNRFFYQSIDVVPGTVYTASVFDRLGAIAVADFKWAIYNESAATWIYVDVAPGGALTAAAFGRVTLTFTAPAGCTKVRLYPFRSQTAIAGNFVSWGAQLNKGAVAASYIPTTTAAVTRPADVAKLVVPVGKSTLTYSFSDGTTTAVGVTAGSVHTVPDTFFPKYITRMVWG